MTFNDDARLDTSEVLGGSGGGGGGLRPGGMVIGGGGGILGIIVLLLYMFLGGGGTPGGDGGSVPGSGGVNPFDASQITGGGQNANTQLFAHCKTGADANRDDNCRIVGTVNSVQAFWREELPRYGKQWKPTKTVLYRGTTQSACGTASNQVGPFYCPLDKRIYMDSSFFDILTRQFGGSSGALAQMYVVAHEYGHALQDQLGLLNRAQQDPAGPESGGVRVELMADCLAGMWVQHAAQTKDSGGRTLLKEPSQEQIQDALAAAAAVGDDNIMKKTSGRVFPEKFTHGTSEQRQRWFMTGYRAQDINACNTFNAQP
ncbi:MAG: neutral zinc metallopeptidase [Austwickia sp.]|nr:neutral zinc metallopeptidase [Austwickia sp.]